MINIPNAKIIIFSSGIYDNCVSELKILNKNPSAVFLQDGVLILQD